MKSARYCCWIGCTADAAFEIQDMGDGSDTSLTDACIAHVGELIGHHSSLLPDALDLWEVRPITDGGCVFCRHPIAEHDMETARCDHVPRQGFGSCPCGRDAQWLQQQVREVNAAERARASVEP